MIRDVIIDVLLGLAVLTVAAAALGVAVMPDAYARLHYVTPAAVVAPVLVTLAIFVTEGLDENTGETIVALFFMIVAAPFLSHATIRAMRVRDRGDWRQPGQRQPADEGEGAAMIPAGLMNTLQVTVLVLVAAGATLVVRTRDRVRQVLALSVYGMLLAILFLVFQAPDVTLSELTVGAVALPIILLLAIAKVRKREQ